jgi:uncharacterized membrane protein YciS (DUF1049 family)
MIVIIYQAILVGETNDPLVVAFSAIFVSYHYLLSTNCGALFGVCTEILGNYTYQAG